MSYPPQQPGGWQDPSWPSPQSGSPYNPTTQPVSGAQPVSGGQPVSGAQPAAPYGGYGYPGYGPPVAAAPANNGMAIASMVVSIVGFLGVCGYGIGGLIGIVGAILGHVARRQIRERGESGDGMALAGIIMGWIATALGLIIIAVIVVAVVWAANNQPTPQ